MHMCVVTEKENRIVKNLDKVGGGGAGGVGGNWGCHESGWPGLTCIWLGWQTLPRTNLFSTSYRLRKDKYNAWSWSWSCLGSARMCYLAEEWRSFWLLLLGHPPPSGIHQAGASYVSGTPEADCLDVIQTKVLRVFHLAIHSHLYGFVISSNSRNLLQFLQFYSTL